MTRPLHATTSTAVGQAILPLAAICRLDILGDPLLCWTGIGDLIFGIGQTGDSALDGSTFSGTGLAADIGVASEGIGGSDGLEISFPGIDLNLPLLRQLITNRNRWQFRRAWVWMMALDPVTSAIAGLPFRIKTGRMDRMPYTEVEKVGVVKCQIEGQQAYGDEALGTRYSEQIDINPTDISQKWVHSLANMTAALGQPTAPAGSGLGSGPGGSNSVDGIRVDFR